MPPSGSDAAALRVRVQMGSPPDELQSLACGEGGSFFQTPSWMRAVHAAEPRLQPAVILAEDAGGGLQAALPLFVARQLGTTRLYAGAWGTYGGIVARTTAGAASVGRHLDSLARRPGVLLVRVHDFYGSVAASGAPADFWCATPESCQVLDVGDDAEALFRGALTSQNRNKIRKAEKLGIQVRRAHDAAALLQYVGLYRESAARWGVERRLPEQLFLALADAPAGVDVWVAERDGEAVAALLNFTCGGQIMNWGNVSRRDAWRFSPNNLLHWRALQAACEDRSGPRLYNFGSSAGLPGVETFKSAFGARERSHSRLEHRAALFGWWRRARAVAPR